MTRSYDYDFVGGYGDHLTRPQLDAARRAYVDAYPSRPNDFRRERDASKEWQAKIAAQKEQHAQAMGKGPNQDRLFLRDADKSETDAEKDYGQWPLYRPIHEEYERPPSITGKPMGKGIREVGKETIGTITVGRKKK